MSAEPHGDGRVMPEDRALALPRSSDTTISGTPDEQAVRLAFRALLALALGRYMRSKGSPYGEVMIGAGKELLARMSPRALAIAAQAMRMPAVTLRADPWVPHPDVLRSCSRGDDVCTARFQRGRCLHRGSKERARRLAQKAHADERAGLSAVSCRLVSVTTS